MLRPADADEKSPVYHGEHCARDDESLSGCRSHRSGDSESRILQNASRERRRQVQHPTVRRPRPGTADPTAAASPQPATAPNPQALATAVTDAAKAEASANSSLTTTVEGAVRDRSSATATASTPTGSSNAGVQAISPFGPQPAAAAGGTAPTPSLNVTAATNAPVPLSGLALEIAASVKNGKSSFDIRLDPAEAGRIDVRIDVTQRPGDLAFDGQKPETLSMLQQDAPQLQRALDDAGLKTGSGGLQFSLRDQSSSGQNKATRPAATPAAGR